MDEKIDPQLIENLEMLMVLDVLEEEGNWEEIERLEDEEAQEDPEVES